MSVESAKEKARTDEKYQLYYGPSIPGRGEPIRLAFEEAGASYEEDMAYTQSGTLTNLLKDETHFAPPILRHDDLEISQLPNIMLYLGQKFKLVPESDEAKFRVNQYFLTIMEPPTLLSVVRYYEDQKDAAKERAKEFREARIPKLFKHFETVLSKNKESKGEWLYGTDLTYADLALYHLVKGLLFAFPRAVGDILNDYPKIFDLHCRVKARPRIAAYLESERCPKFSNGLYRHYEELDSSEKDVPGKGGKE